MNFIEVCKAIEKHPELELCDDETELQGLHPSICVYKNGEFLGKLRWPNFQSGQAASVDEAIIKELKENK